MLDKVRPAVLRLLAELTTGITDVLGDAEATSAWRASVNSHIDGGVFCSMMVASGSTFGRIVRWTPRTTENAAIGVAAFVTGTQLRAVYKPNCSLIDSRCQVAPARRLIGARSEERSMVAAITYSSSVPFGFTKTPNAVLFDPRLPHGAKSLLSILRHHARSRSTCRLRNDTLCRELQVSDNTLRRHRRRLEAVGLLEVKRRGQGRCNEYRLIDPLADSPGARIEIRHRPIAQSADQEPQMLRRIEGDKENEEERATPVETSMATPPAFHDEMTAPCPIRRALLYDPDRAVIARHVRDLSREVGDGAPLPATVSRAAILYRRSGVPLDDFLDHLQAARAATWERSASIRRHTDDGRKVRVPYMMAVLEDRLGLRAAHEERPTAGRGAELPAMASSSRTLNVPPLDDPQTARAWPADLTALGIPDRIAYIRQCGRGPFDDPIASVEFARRHMGRLR